VLARKFGPKAASLAPGLWAIVNDPKGKLEEVVESLSTLARIEDTPDAEAWRKLLEHPQSWARTEAIRWWRIFKDRPALVKVLVDSSYTIARSDPDAKEDLAAVLRHLDKYEALADSLLLPAAEKDKNVLTKWALEALAKEPSAQRATRAALGLQVFERSGCTKCHTTATQTTLLAPSLKGIAQQKPDYLVESILFPSKIIKTGFDSEKIETKSGKTLTGLVKEDGEFFRVLNHEGESRVAKSDVESRRIVKVSIMPEGLEATMSRREFLDLVLFLQTLR
jgi:putative heme-binding domain-containing protein